jgi:hypothetical protein
MCCSHTIIVCARPHGLPVLQLLYIASGSSGIFAYTCRNTVAPVAISPLGRPWMNINILNIQLNHHESNKPTEEAPLSSLFLVRMRELD